MRPIPEWARFTIGAALAGAIIACLILAGLFLAHALTYA